MAYTQTLSERVQVRLVTNVDATVNDASRTKIITGTKTGSKVLEWKGKIARGEAASSPYFFNMTKTVLGTPEKHFGVIQAKLPPYDIHTFSTEGYPGIQFVDFGTLAHLGVDTVKARSVALSQLYKKLENDRSQMNAYASLAEIGDVLRQFGAPFASLVRAFERHHNRLIFERRRLVGSKTWKDEQFARIAADTWLEASFGLIPLLSDAESIAKAFGRWEYELSDSPKLRDRMRSRAVETSTAQSGSYSWLGYSIGFYGPVKTKTEARAQYVVGLTGDVRADFGSNQRLLELLGLEDRNIPLAIWEATPWSWLVDYGTNVQQILQAGATITSRVKWIVLTEVTRTEQHAFPVARCLIESTNPYRLVSFISEFPRDPEKQGTRLIRTTLNRTIPASLGVPPLYFKSPLGDAKKVANLLALAVSKSKDRTTWLS